MEHTKTKDVGLQIVFCKGNFLRLISTQDSGFTHNLIFCNGKLAKVLAFVGGRQNLFSSKRKYF